MRRWTGLVAVTAVFAVFLPSGVANAAPRDKRGPRTYEVTVTNLTRDQRFTPILVASHRPGAQLFELGQPAGADLEALAEEGNTGPLAARLMASPAVGDVNTSAGLLGPGESVTIMVEGGARFTDFSVAAMLIPTNDGFFALNGVTGPGNQGSVGYRAVAYDAGTEINDELCASIPGPDFDECGGPGSGGAPDGGEEGFVHVHSGIHGIGDLEPSRRDWRNPVAAIRIRVMGAAQGDGDDDDDDD